tara:strand:+ start:597 stop:1427 length:831 start_codon:yes stop_codon:yes gene_type:complete
MTNLTASYAVFGNPVEHSKSPDIHQQFAEQTQQAMCYEKKLVPVDAFDSAAQSFFDDGGLGLNITVPFKLAAYHFAAQLTERAKTAGAVNTLIKRDGIIIGDNTDGCGLLRDIRDNLQWPLAQQNILILGAGGAVRGILAPLLAANPQSITIANRSLKKAQTLVEQFQPLADTGSLSCLDYTELNDKYKLIINGTSASLAGQLPAVNSLIYHQAYCYDMMYSKSTTTFLHQAKTSGAQATADGLGMLVEQAAESFYQWRELRPTTKSVIASIRDAM